MSLAMFAHVLLIWSVTSNPKRANAVLLSTTRQPRVDYQASDARPWPQNKATCAADGSQPPNDDDPQEWHRMQKQMNARGKASVAKRPPNMPPMMPDTARNKSKAKCGTLLRPQIPVPPPSRQMPTRYSGEGQRPKAANAHPARVDPPTKNYQAMHSQCPDCGDPSSFAGENYGCRLQPCPAKPPPPKNLQRQHPSPASEQVAGGESRPSTASSAELLASVSTLTRSTHDIGMHVAVLASQQSHMQEVLNSLSNLLLQVLATAATPAVPAAPPPEATESASLRRRPASEDRLALPHPPPPQKELISLLKMKSLQTPRTQGKQRRSRRSEPHEKGLAMVTA